MIKALIPVNAGLESSIALRYAKELSRRIDVMLHDIHVVEAEKVGSAPGSGWVLNTWENAMLETANQEIHQFLEMENLGLNRLGDSEIVIGDRTEKLLETLENGDYQLFMEGALPTFNPSDFISLIHSRLYRFMSCPALIVKNLVALDKVALLVEKDTYPELVADFASIFSSSGIEPDFVDVRVTRSGEATVREADSLSGGVEKAADMLSEQGMSVKLHVIVEGPVSKVAQQLRTYGLVAASLPQHHRRSEPKLELLGRVSSPVLVCWSKHS